MFLNPIFARTLLLDKCGRNYAIRETKVNTVKQNQKTKDKLAQAKAAYQARVSANGVQTPDKGKKPRKTKAGANKRQASEDTEEKVEQVQPDAEDIAIGKYIATGSRGTAFLLSLPSALEIGERVAPMEKLHLREDLTYRQVGDLHAKGKTCGVVWIDSMSWIAPRGEKYSVWKLSDAIKKGIVKKVRGTIERDGMKAKQATFYVSSKLNTKAEKLPHCLATMDVPAGRVEVRLVNDKRNESLVYKVKLAQPKS